MPVFPFSAIVGQDEMKLALISAAIDPGIGGVLILGDRGTGKSTAVRALAAVLPAIRVMPCRYGCDPDQPGAWCPDCGAASSSGQVNGHAALNGRAAVNGHATHNGHAALNGHRMGAPTRKSAAKSTRQSATKASTQRAANTVNIRQVPVPVVDLPLGATEDRVVGALDLQRALTEGVKAFEPGLLARANRGFLYIDEVNLLEDHLVDLLIDVAASGQNVVEREGLSMRHPARFVIVGSGNPEEGELRPQLLDRFGLSVEVRTPTDLPTRIEVIRRRDEFERHPDEFMVPWQRKDAQLRKRIEAARTRLRDVLVDDAALSAAAQLCMNLGTDGLRGELTLVRAARVLAAYAGDPAVTKAHLRQVAAPALRHRLRRNPLDETGATVRVERAVQECLCD